MIPIRINHLTNKENNVTSVAISSDTGPKSVLQGHYAANIYDSKTHTKPTALSESSLGRRLNSDSRF